MLGDTSNADGIYIAVGHTDMRMSIAYESDHQCLFLNHPVPQIRPSSALTRPKLKESPKMGLSLV